MKNEPTHTIRVDGNAVVFGKILHDADELTG
jgi:hypothetical protein